LATQHPRQPGARPCAGLARRSRSSCLITSSLVSGGTSV
jgi:hypothetical protein